MKQSPRHPAGLSNFRANLPRGAVMFALGALGCWATARAATAPAAVGALPQTFEESTQVVSVEVPVNVVGRDGQPVRGLTADDFEIFDEGQRQQLSSFSVVDFAVTRQAGPTPSDEYLRGMTKRRFLLLFDLTFSTPSAVLKARLAARDFILHSLHPGDLAAVGTVSLEQGFRSVVTFTPDRAQIARGIDTLGYHPGDSFARVDPLHFVIASSSGAAVEAPPSSEETGKLGDVRGDSRGALREYLSALSVMAERDQRNFDRSRITRMLRILGDLARSLDAVRGRKNVVFFSEGFDSVLLLGRDPAQTQAQQEEAYQVATGDIWRVDSDQRYGNTGLQSNSERTLEEFRRADCAIQAVDIGGLRSESDLSKHNSGQDALFFMANETGGELFKNANNLRAELDRVLERSNLTYLLTFERADVKSDGAYHRLRVRAKLPGGARISHRAGYYAPRPFKELSPLERNLLASDSIASAVPRRDIDVKTLVAPFRAGPGQAYVPVIVEIGGESLLGGQRGERLNVEIYAYVSDRQGEMRDFFTQNVRLELGKSRGMIEHSGIKYYGHLDLPSGDYLVRVLVRNGETGRSGVESVRLTVPDYKAPVLLPPFFIEPAGRWVMVRETDGKPAQKTVVYPFTVNGEPYVPSAAPEVTALSPARLCLVAYNLGAGAPSLEGQVLDGSGAVISAATLSLVERTATGIAGYDQLLASFDAKGLTPGSYTLRVGLVDRASGAKQVNTIPIEVRN